MLTYHLAGNNQKISSQKYCSEIYYGIYYIVSSGNQNTSILPIEVSKENLNRTYQIADELIKAIEGFEGYVATYARDGYDIGYFT